MTKVAVVLSGCGFMDGSEIHESVLCLLALAQEGCSYHCFAPDIPQAEVVDHYHKKPVKESRNVLVEAARIARGQISPIQDLDPTKFDAILLPGGGGAAKNLSNYASKAADCEIHPELKRVLASFHSAKKPIGACCIAPAVVGRALQDSGAVQMTLGSSPATLTQLEALGMKGQLAHAHEMVADLAHKVYTTPCYMEAPNLAGMYEGVRKLVKEIVSSSTKHN